ncbi:MAG: response regulator transcription factor, partial [Thermoleophilia bacterium]|nr:response regulator transcription factor [Thermoleophilia bacterium]
RESLHVSLREGLEDHAGRAYSNLIWTLLDYRNFDEAGLYLAQGLEYAGKRELEGSRCYMTAERARLHLSTGRWGAAERDARWVVNRPEEPGITRMPALATLAQLLVRRGDEDALRVLDEARALAEPTGELQRIAPVAVARAECEWLRDDLPALRLAVEPIYADVADTGQPWVVDELAFWMWRAGAPVEVPSGLRSPYIDQMRGRWQAAAETWDKLGCPYERATALCDSAERDPLMLALEILDALGAAPAARLVRRKLRKLGVRNVPRGPRPSTRANPAGLTGRQLEVVELLVEGLTNAEIAERLFVSPKTVDHHVSAALTKLDARSRREAARIALELGLIRSD